VVSAQSRANGIGAVDTNKLDQQIALIGQAFNLPKVPARADIYDDRFLPPLADRKFAD
jgi:NitT/TauT family transport system substrate-binding protein